MKRWRPVIIGCLLGLTAGLCLLFFVKANDIPWIVIGPVQATAGFLRRILMPNSDPMGALVFMIPLIPLYCAAVGACVGVLFCLLLSAMRKRSLKTRRD